MVQATRTSDGGRSQWAWAVAALPALLSVSLVWRYGVDVPFLDQWDMAPIFSDLSLAELWKQHNESRVVFPKLVWLVLGTLTDWNVRADMLLTQLVVGATGLNVGVLAKRGGLLDGAPGLVALPLAALLLFSPVQWWNFTFGFPLVVYVPALCLTSCLVIAGASWRPATRWLVCAGLCAVATFSFANGMLCWGLAPLALVGGSAGRDRAPAAVFAIFALAALAVLALYFHDYAAPTHHPGFGVAVGSPGATALGFLAFLGAPLALGSESTSLAAAIGAGELALFGVLSARVLGSADAGARRAAVPWWVLAGYAGASGVLVAAGRIGFGAEAVLHSRLTAFSIPFAVALVFLGALVVQDARRGTRGTSGVVAALGVALAVLGVGLHLATAAASLGKYPAQEAQRWRAKAVLLMTPLLVSDEIETLLYPDIEKVTQRAEALDSLGLLRPGLIRDVAAARAPGPPDPGYGSVEAIVPLSGGWIGVEGSAWLPDEGRVADAVVVALGEGDGGVPVALAFVRARDERPLFRVRSRGTPRGVSVYALDASSGRLHPLAPARESTTLTPRRTR